MCHLPSVISIIKFWLNFDRQPKSQTKAIHIKTNKIGNSLNASLLNNNLYIGLPISSGGTRPLLIPIRTHLLDFVIREKKFIYHIGVVLTD